MTRPPFRLDGKPGATLRYTARDGRVRLSSGRRCDIYGRTYIDALLTGQAPSGVYEMRITHDGPWHRLRLTPEEAVERLAGHPLTRAHLHQLTKRSDYIGPYKWKVEVPE